MDTKKSPHEILGVRFGATPEELRSAFKQLAKEYHPDANGGEDDGRFAEIIEARKALEGTVEAVPKFPLQVPMLLLFRGGVFVKEARLKERCLVCRGEGELATRVCPACNGGGYRFRSGEISVEIPKGVPEGAVLSATFLSNGQTANIQVVIEDEPHPAFRRSGRNITGRIVISQRNAKRGGILMIEGPDSEPLSLSVPNHLKTGHQISFEGLGLPNAEGTLRGSLTLDVIVRRSSLKRRLTEWLGRR